MYLILMVNGLVSLRNSHLTRQSKSPSAGRANARPLLRALGEFHGKFMPIEIRFFPRKIDLVVAGYVGLRARPVISLLFFAFFVVTPWFFAILTIVLRLPLNYSTTISFCVIPPFTILALLVLPVLIHWKSPSLNGEHIYRFSDTEIQVSGPGFDNHMQWSLVSRFVKLHGVYMLFSNKLPIITIPKRAIQSSIATEFEQLLKSKIKKV